MSRFFFPHGQKPPIPYLGDIFKIDIGYYSNLDLKY